VVGAQSRGFLTLYPYELRMPNTSTISFGAGQTRGNNVVIGVSTEGSAAVTVYNGSTGSVDLIIDVSGYFD